MGGHHIDEHGDTPLNCGSAALGHTFIQLSKISPGNKVPLALGRSRLLLRLISELHCDEQESIKCCQNAVSLTAL